MKISTFQKFSDNFGSRLKCNYFLKPYISRGGRGKLFIGASCATPNCSLVNIYAANVILPPEKSEPEISIYHVCPPVQGNDQYFSVSPI